MIVGILIYVGFFTFGESFIRLWMFHPESFPYESIVKAAQVMAILSCSKLLILYSSSFSVLLSATGHIGFIAKLSMVQAFLNIALSVFFVLMLNWGVTGIAAGTLFARLLTSTFIIPPYACHKVGINFWRYVTVIGGRGFGVAVAFSLVCYGVQYFLPARNWLEFSLQVLLSTICYIPLALLLLVSVEDRKRLKNKLLEYSPI